jgi:uncharacterized protein (TIGR04551 family)
MPCEVLSDEEPTQWGVEEVKISPLITLKNKGYFRLRYNVFYALDLGSNGASGFKPPLENSTANQALQVSGSVVEQAVMRFRYEPELLVGEILKIGTRIDFFDNMVFGSSPTFDTTDAPFPIFAKSQDPLYSFKDTISVKALFADLRIFKRIHMYGGRMPEHFGLGILRNSGSSLDSDFGDHIDCIFFKLNLPKAFFRVGMEFPGEGAVQESPLSRKTEPHDLDQFDDIQRWVFVFDTVPIEPEQIKKRHEALYKKRELVFDLAMYHAITRQGLSSEKTNTTLQKSMPGTCQNSGSQIPFAVDYNCIALTPRSAFFWTPSVWGRVLWRPKPGLSLRMEGEVAMVYGHIDHTQNFLNIKNFNTRKDFFGLGAALETEIDYFRNNFRFYTGVATGDDDSHAFGVLDSNTINEPNDEKYKTEAAKGTLKTTNSTVRSFVFNRDYRIDSILFREVIGAVTNAFYFYPSYRRVFYRASDMTFGAGLGVLFAFATNTGGTPSGHRPLGVETSLEAFLKVSPGLLIKANGALLLPLSGLRTRDAKRNPDPALALRLGMFVNF